MCKNHQHPTISHNVGPSASCLFEGISTGSDTMWAFLEPDPCRHSVLMSMQQEVCGSAAWNLRKKLSGLLVCWGLKHVLLHSAITINTLLDFYKNQGCEIFPRSLQWYLTAIFAFITWVYFEGGGHRASRGLEIFGWHLDPMVIFKFITPMHFYFIPKHL